MSILEELEKTAKDIDHKVEHIAAEIDKDRQKAIDVVKSGVDCGYTLTFKAPPGGVLGSRKSNRRPGTASEPLDPGFARLTV